MSPRFGQGRSRELRARGFVGFALAGALIVAACGGSDGTAGEIETNDASTSTSATSEAPEATEAPEVTEAPDESTTATTDDSSEPPTDEGAPLDFGPAEGQRLDVANVRFDDVLNFRSGPGTDEDVVMTIAPLAEAPIVLAAGEAWAFERSVWWKVTIDGEEMWANQSFLGMLGEPASIFDEVSTVLDSIEAETIEELAQRVAATRSNEEPAPSVVLSGEPLAFDAVGGFAVVDLDGFLDDSVRGERLRVEVEFEFADDDSAPPIVRLVEVIATPICSRGVSDGLCL